MLLLQEPEMADVFCGLPEPETGTIGIPWENISASELADGGAAYLAYGAKPAPMPEPTPKLSKRKKRRLKRERCDLAATDAVLATIKARFDLQEPPEASPVDWNAVEAMVRRIELLRRLENDVLPDELQVFV